MKCTLCEKEAVYSGHGHYFCKTHFIKYFENKVFRTIKKYKLISHDDRVCVAVSGGKDSLAALYMVSKYCKKYDIEFFALAVDEGIHGYREKTLEDLKVFCDENKITLHKASFKEMFGTTIDESRDFAMNELNKKPCTVCGVFRRTILNRKARELKATKLVTGHNLDDEAESYFMNVLKGNVGHSAALGPVSGLFENEKFVTRVKPLYFVSEKETRLFCLLKGFQVQFTECPHVPHSFRAEVKATLNELEGKYAGVKHGIVNSFMEMLPDLKKRYKNKKEFSYCERCGDACSGKVCNACQLEEKLCKK